MAKVIDRVLTEICELFLFIRFLCSHFESDDVLKESYQIATAFYYLFTFAYAAI
jgi:hypothetical protein